MEIVATTRMFHFFLRVWLFMKGVSCNLSLDNVFLGQKDLCTHFMDLCMEEQERSY